MNRVLEFYGESTRAGKQPDWVRIASAEYCKFLDRKCIKVRKSEPDKTIGTCSVEHGRERLGIVICPHRLLERNQIFTDCVHLLALHEPGNTLHVVSEVTVPGGSVDYFLVSARGRSVKDFVGIELQTLDTTGTVWPERQSLLREKGVPYGEQNPSDKSFGMNWKMTAKTILVQLHHKVETFESVNKHLVLVVQDRLLDYMRQSFDFSHLEAPKLGNSMHIHTYGLESDQSGHFHIDLRERFSTDARGVAQSLGLQQEARVELEEIIALLESKISEDTVLYFQRS